MVSLLANIGIIFLAFYFYLRSKLGILAYQENRKISYFIKCVFAEVLLGMILLSFSIVIMDIRFDFRFLLFCFSAKYLDWKITSSSIVLLAILRFFWGSIDIAQTNLLASIMIAVTLPLLVHYTKDKMSDLSQLLILVTISIMLFACGYAATFIMYHFITDLYSLIASANTDDLTTLKNGRTFNAKLLEIERNMQSVTVAMIDVDYFKDYNDRYGHDSGDALLKQLGQAFHDFSKPGIVFYRIGGDEIAVIIHHSSHAEAETFLVALQEKLSQWDFSIASGESVGVSISIGVAHRDDGEKLKKTLSRADVALYKAKKDGRNKVILYFPS